MVLGEWVSRFGNTLLSPVVIIIAGGLSAIAYVIYSDAFDRITYAMSYASGQVRTDLWTEAQYWDFVNHAIVNNAPSLILPLLGIVGITVTLVLLQRELRLKRTAMN